MLGLLLLLAGAPAAEDCLALYHGVGVARDLPKARRCLEKQVATPCGGDSPDLARAELAVMYLDAQGGPAEPAKAWKLLEGCYADITLETLQGTFKGRKPTGTFDFCGEIGGTTITINECAAVELDLASASHEAAAAKALAAAGAAARPALEAAEKAWAVYVEANAALGADEARGGTAATGLGLGSRTSDEEGRAQWLEALAAGKAPASCGDAAFKAADGKLNREYRAAMGRIDKQGQALLRKAQLAWIQFRDADAAFEAQAFGASSSPAIVETSVKCRLTEQRARELASVGAER